MLSVDVSVRVVYVSVVSRGTTIDTAVRLYY